MKGKRTIRRRRRRGNEGWREDKMVMTTKVANIRRTGRHKRKSMFG